MSDLRHQLYMWLIGDRLNFWRFRIWLRKAKRQKDRGEPITPYTGPLADTRGERLHRIVREPNGREAAEFKRSWNGYGDA